MAIWMICREYTHCGIKLEIDSEKVFPSKTRTKKKIATNITLNAENIGANFYGMNQPQHPHNPNEAWNTNILNNIERTRSLPPQSSNQPQKPRRSSNSLPPQSSNQPQKQRRPKPKPKPKPKHNRGSISIGDQPQKQRQPKPKQNLYGYQQQSHQYGYPPSHQYRYPPPSHQYGYQTPSHQYGYPPPSHQHGYQQRMFLYKFP